MEKRKLHKMSKINIITNDKHENALNDSVLKSGDLDVYDSSTIIMLHWSHDRHMRMHENAIS